MKDCYSNPILVLTLDKVGVVPGVAMAPPDFGRSVEPILTKGADYAHQIILAPPDFQTFLRPCNVNKDLKSFGSNYVRRVLSQK